MNSAPTLDGDIPVGNWIDRHVPAVLRPYLRLMRLDRPIGTWLLLFPCWWSIALAGDGQPDWLLMGLFAVGAVVMRGAGCTINDIADHKFDAQVERTRGRPIPSGAVTLKQAWAFLVAQLLVGLAILVTLPPVAIALGVGSLALVFPYPLMKRITWWPQAWLGLTFNWGALMGWAAVTGDMALPPLLFYAAGILWTLGYDTIYAHQDKEDDALIGVKSTALRLAAATPRWVVGFYAGTLVLMAAAGWAADLGLAFYPLLGVAGLQLAWQVATGDIDDSADCLEKFKSNRWFGWLVLGAILAGKVA
ncbi:4-hydroxybenzoate octaprenyltransferase [Magnetospirillum aberrantis]|uniref:4-hydroxybenzoate octaprenyltransferase n=1 Tax=Magnetospirillum aberrantis SpK TaxID=908842 RepID=A0A7C9UV96_9PROT|nr:4-hydroxybenzoate octaprenyltransferase [Magnetospirillum aberrantis]NFV81268.1 4-hydroxybenzoate octaprenyltransferase [Magnetospirillum aberrantis SpK]